MKSANEARSELSRSAAEHELEIRDLQQKIASLQRELDNATAQNAGLRQALEKLGTNVDELLTEKGVLASALNESRARLDELRRAQAAAEARAQLYRELALKLKNMVDTGSLSIALRDGRMVLQLPNDVLFDTGRTEIKPQGLDGLRQVGAVLKSLTGRKFHVGGHTDNIPIATHRFPSNWELSVARGLAVMYVLMSEGVPATMVAAEGYGEYDPIATNDSDEGRAKNRRTEISLQPNVDEIVAVPEATPLLSRSLGQPLVFAETLRRRTSQPLAGGASYAERGRTCSRSSISPTP